MGKIQIKPYLFYYSFKCCVLTTILCVFVLFIINSTGNFTVINRPIKDYFLQNFGWKREAVIGTPFQCTQSYPMEAKTEYSTFDMYATIVNPKKRIAAWNQHKVRKKNSTGTVEIYVLPFTHVDPGWLETFDEYSDSTNAILNNMLVFLKTHPKMRFMWCEIAFFERWWSMQNDSSKALIRRYISRRQLEIASGSWVMTDEATPYFPSTVDNIIEGQQFVYDELHVQARAMWSNDPFGYGSSVFYLFTKTGINWGVINRIHHVLKLVLQQFQVVPFRWRQYFDPTGKNDMYTHVLPYAHYDVLNSCGPDAIVCCQYDFKRLNHFSCPGPRPVPINSSNVAEKARTLEEQLLKMSKLQKTNILLTVWGDDFRYDDLEEWYQQYNNLMPLFDYINTHSNRAKIRFGTFTDYFTALEQNDKAENRMPVTLSGDFFPYRCAANDYWTGYYTTRPFYKRQERVLHSFIRAADLLSTSTFMYSSPESRQTIGQILTKARRNLALFQHHDAITGTSKNHVMKDYSQRMFGALKLAEDVLRMSLSSLLSSNDFEIDNIPLVYNESSSKKLIDVNQPRTVLVYNSEPYRRMEPVELLVSTPYIIVRESNAVVRAQIEPYFDSVTGSFTDKFLLLFFALLQPLSFNQYVIQSGRSESTEMAQILIRESATPTLHFISKDFRRRTVDQEYFQLHTPQLTVNLDSATGLLTDISLGDALGSTDNGTAQWLDDSTRRLKCSQSFAYFGGSEGGAYVMRTSNAKIQRLRLHSLERFIVSGSLRQTAYSLSDFVKQRLILNDLPGAEGNRLHMHQRIDIRNLQNIELIAQFATDLDAENIQFYTDSNGLQLIKRAAYEGGFVPEMNYYPMPTALVLEDDMRRLSVLSNVPHGVRIYNETNFEIMLDRRLSRDDGKGLGSEDGIPRDNLPINIAFTFVLEKMILSNKNQQKQKRQHRRFAYNTLAAHLALQSLIYQPYVFTAQGALKELSFQHFSPFPCDVQLLTVRPLSSDINLRLMILHRAGIDCSTLNATICLATELDVSFLELLEAVKYYLSSIGALTVQKTLLNGVEKIGKEMDYTMETFFLEPMDFAAYLIRFG